jgi:hypothetical protein
MNATKFCVTCEKLTDHQTHRHREALAERQHTPSQCPVLHVDDDDEDMTANDMFEALGSSFRIDDTT